MNTEITSYDPVRAAIANLTKNYKDVIFNVTTADGLSDAKAVYKEINGFSIILENARVKEKAAALAYGKFIDSEAKKISEQLDALRLPIKAQIESETLREKREAEAKAKADAERLAELEAIAKAQEETKMAETRDKIRKDQEAIAKAAEAIAEANRLAAAKIESERRAAQEKIDADEREARAKREQADRVAKAARDKADAEARAVAEKKRKAQEAADEKQREITRAAHDKADGREALAVFVNRFEKYEEFKEICAQIREFLKA